jgi:hypothetical protein
MQEVANDELMPPKRRLFRFKMACGIWKVRMTCSYPPEARRPVTIVVVTYKDRGDSPFTHEVSLNDARVRVAQRPLREVPTCAGDLFVFPVWDNVTHTTLTLSTDVNRPTVSRLDQRLSFSHSRIGMNSSQNTENSEFFISIITIRSLSFCVVLVPSSFYSSEYRFSTRTNMVTVFAALCPWRICTKDSRLLIGPRRKRISSF